MSPRSDLQSRLLVAVAIGSVFVCPKSGKIIQGRRVAQPLNTVRLKPTGTDRVRRLENLNGRNIVKTFHLSVSALFGGALVAFGCNAGPLDSETDALDVSAAVASTSAAATSSAVATSTAVATSSAAAASTSFSIYSFTGTNDMGWLGADCYLYGGSFSDTGAGSYKLTVGDLNSNDRTRLETAISNGSATLNIEITEYLYLFGEITAWYKDSYKVTYYTSGVPKNVLEKGEFSRSLSEDTASVDYSNTRSVAINLAAAGVRSTLRASDYFEVTFASTVGIECTEVNESGIYPSNSAYAIAYLSNVYGSAKASITGTY